MKIFNGGFPLQTEEERAKTLALQREKINVAFERLCRTEEGMIVLAYILGQCKLQGFLQASEADIALHNLGLSILYRIRENDERAANKLLADLVLGK